MLIDAQEIQKNLEKIELIKDKLIQNSNKNLKRDINQQFKKVNELTLILFNSARQICLLII